MPAAPTVLIVDSSASDTELCGLLLRREWSEAHVTTATDAATLAAALTGRAPDLAVVGAKLTWAGADRVLAILREHCPDTALLLFGHESDIVARCMHPGLVFDGLLRKSSAGFMALAPTIRAVLERRARARLGAAPLPELDALPVAGFLADERGVLTVVNAPMRDFTDGALEGRALDTLLADAAAREQWRAFAAADGTGRTRLEESRRGARITAGASPKSAGCPVRRPRGDFSAS